MNQASTTMITSSTDMTWLSACAFGIAPNKPHGCFTPNALQRAGLKVQTAIANATNRTIGVGFSGSAALGVGGFGLATSATAQMVVQPDGQASLVYTYTPPEGSYVSPSSRLNGESAAALIGFTVSVSKGQAFPISLDGSYQNVAASISSAGGSFTFGYGVGARAGLGPDLPFFTATVPICK